MASSRTPKYRLHRATGLAVVTLSGRDHYLGKHGTPESRKEYDRRIAEWLSGGRHLRPKASSDLSVSEVLAAHWAVAKVRHTPAPGSGGSWGQWCKIRAAVTLAEELYGHTAAADFGPIAFRAVMAKAVEKWSVEYAKAVMRALKTAFSWAVSEELVPPGVYEGLRRVRSNLQPERGRVVPVPDEHIEPVLLAAGPIIGAILRLQLLTGARPSELLEMRPAQIDRRGATWNYRPARHKTQHHGIDRAILIGPQAQEVLRPFLLRDADTYCFCPREAELRGPGGCCQPGERYSRESYYRAVVRACARAGVPRWSPYRLRHNAATRIMAEFGWDVARIILGHKTLDATRIYGEDDLAKAAAAARKIG